ncbi:angiopoietin-related protein 2-like [Watersipora subatra]|uniref:angiopoietin-related protein 2-like n=1 Tax=Watersipora subatra TaxID=2589382 RepID=UPI00355B0D8B
MKRFQLAALFVLISIASSNLLGPNDDSQELFIYQQRIYALHQLLKIKCPELIRLRRELVDDTSLPFALSADKMVYNRLLQALVECTSNKSLKSEPSPTTVKLLASKEPNTNKLFTKKLCTTPVPTTNTTTSVTANSVTVMTTTSATTTSSPTAPKDCQELYDRGWTTPGVYLINPSSSNMTPFRVWCDFFDNHGWTVFQKRFNGNVNFAQNWTAYEQGFGNLTGEYWLGLEKLHALTQTNRKLNIHLETTYGSVKSGTWSNFSVSSEQDYYKLYVSDADYHGTLDSSDFSLHNGMKFSTTDRDNDVDSGNCAEIWTVLDFH